VPADESPSDEEETEGSTADALALRSKRRCRRCATAMDSYLVDEKRKLHVCHDSPDCPGTEVEEGAFKLKGYEGPIIPCDKCGADMKLRMGRFGKYFACDRYPDCRNTRKLLRNGQPAPPKAPPVPMPELRCANSDDFFVLRDGAAGIFLSASTFPRSREARAPEVADLKRHRAELDPKFHYLADAPERDDEGNPALVRFDRKAREHYLSSVRDGEATGWSGRFADGGWTITRPEAQPGKGRARGAGRSRRKGPASKKDKETDA